MPENTDTRNFGPLLLRLRDEWPSSGPSGENSDYLAASHWASGANAFSISEPNTLRWVGRGQTTSKWPEPRDRRFVSGQLLPGRASSKSGHVPCAPKTLSCDWNERKGCRKLADHPLWRVSDCYLGTRVLELGRMPKQERTARSVSLHGAFYFCTLLGTHQKSSLIATCSVSA